MCPDSGVSYPPRERLGSGGAKRDVIEHLELHERSVSITSGTTSSTRVNPGVEREGDRRYCNYEEIASNSGIYQSLGIGVITTITHLYSVVTHKPTRDKFKLVLMWWVGRRENIDGGDRYDVHMLRLCSPGSVPPCRLSTGLTRY